MLVALYKALLLKPSPLAACFWRPLLSSLLASPTRYSRESDALSCSLDGLETRRAFVSQQPPSRLSPSPAAARPGHPTALSVGGGPRQQDDGGSSQKRSFSTSAVPDPPSTICSRRGQAAVELLPTYLADARAVECYDEHTHPTGPLQLSVAEWKGLQDLLVPALNELPPIHSDAIYYQPTAGRPGLKLALAKYMESLLDLEPGRVSSTDLEGLVVGAGCNAVLENLCICLANPGDAVLIPTPYYAAFEFDLGARAALAVEPVVTGGTATDPTNSDGCGIDPSLYYPTRESLDAAYKQAIAKGHPPRILLLCHPQNPLGICYPPAVVKECIDWCRERQVHLISDEIYAGSVYGDDPDFCSVLKLADDDHNGLGDYVHWVYALSKDFCLSGLRVGAVYTENEAVQLPLQKLNDFCQISSTTQEWVQHVLSKRLNDQQHTYWTAHFRRENHDRLRSRSQLLTALLERYRIPYLQPTAGLFCWMDLSQFLPHSSSGGEPAALDDQERERQLYLELIHEHGLLLTPGLSMRHTQPGFFRCVFTAASDEEFALSLERFAAMFEAKNSR